MTEKKQVKCDSELLDEIGEVLEDWNSDMDYTDEQAVDKIRAIFQQR